MDCVYFSSYLIQELAAVYFLRTYYFYLLLNLTFFPCSACICLTFIPFLIRIMSIFELFLLSFYMSQPFFFHFIYYSWSHRCRCCLHFYLVLYPRSHQMFSKVILLSSFKEILSTLFVIIKFVYLFQ
jgi:hypothetical protein